MEPPSEISGTTWGALTPTSFQTTLYVPCLKISITAGSFIRFSKGESAPQVGRIIDVVSSIDSVPQPENHPLIQTPLPDNFDVGIQLQFAKVNLFIDRLLLSDREFPAETSSSCDGWQGIVQLDGYEWIPSHLIIGLSFVFMEEDMLSHSFDDCRGMSNFFVLKYRQARIGNLSVIPRHECPPFPACIEQFQKLWSVCHCELIFNSIRQIRQDMQRILCRVAQSQGDFAVKNAKLQLPSCSWFYIKNTMATQGIDSIVPTVHTGSATMRGFKVLVRRRRGFIV